MKTLTSEITREVTRKRMKDNADTFIDEARNGMTATGMKCPNCGAASDEQDVEAHFESEGELGPDILLWWVCHKCDAQFKTWYVLDEIATITVNETTYDLTE